MRFGAFLLALLERHGVTHVFGIPGVHTAELYRGLAGSPIRHVTPRHEQGAGFMADGYARLTGKPGVCFVITGPGLTNIATAMGQAYQDSIPMLVISGVNATPGSGMATGTCTSCPTSAAWRNGSLHSATRCCAPRTCRRSSRGPSPCSRRRVRGRCISRCPST